MTPPDELNPMKRRKQRIDDLAASSAGSVTPAGAGTGPGSVAVLDAGGAVRMEDRGRESPRRLVRGHGRLENKKPVRRPPNGFGTCIRGIPG